MMATGKGNDQNLPTGRVKNQNLKTNQKLKKHFLSYTL